MTTLNIATLNVDGMAEDRKRTPIIQTLKSLNCDIIALQETHIIKEKIDKVKEEWGKDSIWNPAPKNNVGGTAILLGNNTNKSNFKIQTSGRITTIKIKVEDATLQLTNVYAPNEPQNREDFFDDTKKHMFQTKHTILTGDFNMIEDTQIDRNPPSTHNIYKKGIKNLTTIKQMYKLEDKWRNKNPNKRTFTWNSRKTNDKTASRLDRIYLSDKIILVDQQHIRTIHSDHNIVIAKIIIQTNTPRGPGYWKLNTRILEQPEYITQMNNTITQRKYDEQNTNTWWDGMKL